MNEEQAAEQLASGDVKEVQVKTANKAVRIMRQEAAAKRDPTGVQGGDLDDSDDMKLESVLSDIISQTLADKMAKGDPEFKVFKENYDRVLEYYVERYDHIPDENHHEIFCEINDRIEEFISILSKQLYEFCDLSQFFCKAIKKMNPLTTVDDSENSKNKNTFLLVVETIAQIGNRLLNTDPQQTEAYFLEYAIDDLIEIVEVNIFKRNEMMYLFYCFMSNTVNSHLRVLHRLKEKMTSRDAFYYSLSKLLIYENDAADLAPELYSFYFENAAYGLLSSSPVTRTKSVTVLSYLSKASIEPIIPLLPRLESYASDVYWELKGQVLILCANTLIAFNTIEDDDGEGEGTGEGPMMIQQNDGEEAHKVDVDELPESIHEEPEEEKEEDTIQVEPIESSEMIHESPEMDASEIREQPEEQINDTQNLSKIELLQKLSEENQPLIFNIINQIFVPEAPKATLKIGLIYLAKILHFYPDFADQYLTILLSVPDAIRTSVVDVNPLPGTEEEVLVAGATTEKYRTYGAPMEWNPVYIATSLEAHIKNNELENLDWAHIEIFEACLQQDFDENAQDSYYEKWISIFNSLKSYFFISLCDPDFCRTSIEILKKIYIDKTMQTQFIKESRDIFVKTLRLLYQPDVEQQCKDMVKEFLEFLHSEDSPALKKLVYDVIKYFAEKNTDKFQSSNLIDLTASVVLKKRGVIFHSGSTKALPSNKTSNSQKGSSIGFNSARQT